MSFEFFAFYRNCYIAEGFFCSQASKRSKSWSRCLAGSAAMGFDKSTMLVKQSLRKDVRDVTAPRPRGSCEHRVRHAFISVVACHVHAGVFRRVRFSSLPGRNTSSPKNACVGGYFCGGRNECVTNEPQRTSAGRLRRYHFSSGHRKAHKVRHNILQDLLT